ncbi:MAG: glycosyltransferase family 2 protein [Polyangia bacterium]
MIVVATVALTAILYTYLGYPIVLLVLSRLFPQRVVTDASWTPRVTALIPAYNAASYLPAKLDSLLALDWPADRLQILVYSDGATDETDAIARDYAERDARVQLVVGGTRQGKPTAVNRMLELASGEVLLMTDIRQPLERGCLRALTTRLAPPEVACVSGNLLLPTTAGAGVYWRYENALRNHEARFRSMLGVTGPIYVIRKADLPGIPKDMILDDMWIPLRLRLQGRKLLFADDAIAHDQAFDDEREFGRKVRTLAGQYQLLGKLPGLLAPWSNPSWFEFMSHKIMRLVCPWALLALFVSLPVATAMEHGPLLPVLALVSIGQLGFYGLAILGDRGTKLGQVARTFVVLNAAAVVGLWRQLSGAQRVTW